MSSGDNQTSSSVDFDNHGEQEEHFEENIDGARSGTGKVLTTKYFVLVEVNKMMKGKCNFCLKILSYDERATTNLIKHLVSLQDKFKRLLL
mgnify:CR=1 FL=1